MKINRRKLFGIIIILFLLVGIFIYFNIWAPSRKIMDTDWWITASPEESRALAHKILSYPFGNHHDAFIILIRHGNEESIPCLLKRLKHYHVQDDAVECSHDHCVEALRNITGKDFGYEYADWEKGLYHPKFTGGQEPPTAVANNPS